MSQDSAVEEDLGEATIVYEDPDGTVEESVPNEHVAYFQDHWIVKTGEDDRGRDTVIRIPAHRVYHVERTVQEFEEEISTVVDQVRSITDDLRKKLPVGGEGRDERSRRRVGGKRSSPGRSDPVDIEVERDADSGEEGGSDRGTSQPTGEGR